MTRSPTLRRALRGALRRARDLSRRPAHDSAARRSHRHPRAHLHRRRLTSVRRARWRFATARSQFVGSEREALLLRGAVDADARRRRPDRHPRDDRRARAPVRARASSCAASISPTRARTTKSSHRVAARVKDAPSGRWIIGRGWDQNKWGDTRFPTHEALSRVSPNNPVVLERIDGHAVLANAAAMRAAGVTAATKDPAGGRIERGANGEPTGVFVDNAMGLDRSRRAADVSRRDAKRHARRDRRIATSSVSSASTTRASRATSSTSSRSWRRRAPSASASTP